jgi:hypothetical protein
MTKENEGIRDPKGSSPGEPPVASRSFRATLIALAAVAALAAIVGYLVVGERIFVDTTGALPQEVGPQEEPDVIVPPTPATPAPSPLPATPAQPPQPVQ